MILGFRRRESADVGCYGKLPLYGDYVSHASDGAEARRLASWLDAGYLLTAGEDDRGETETRFLFPAQGKRIFFGALWPSSDASGTRKFPFTLFSIVPTKELAPHGAWIPYALATLWDQLSLAYPSLRGTESVESIRSQLLSLKLPPLPGVEAARESYKRDAGLPGAEVGAARDVLLDLLRFTEALPRRRGDPPAFAVRIPLRTGYAPEVEAVAWLRFFSQKLGTPDVALRSHVFLRTNRKDLSGDLFLFHRELKDSDLVFVLSPTDDYPYANLLGEPAEGPGAESFAEWFEESAGAGATMNDLVAFDLSKFKEA